jgi:hypothetical protein
MNTLNNPWQEIPSFQRIDRPLRQVSDLIRRSLVVPGEPPELAPFLGHLRTCSGKMLRPAMVLLAGECCGTLTDAHLQVSAMVEMITMPLLHDDVPDGPHATRRPGHRLWETNPPCSGVLPSRSFAPADSAVARIPAQTAHGFVREPRQTQQCTATGDSQYLEIITERALVLRQLLLVVAMLSQA